MNVAFCMSAARPLSIQDPPGKRTFGINSFVQKLPSHVGCAVPDDLKLSLLSVKQPPLRMEPRRMQIGLIGGIGPAATDFYYRRLISAFAGKRTGLELTIVHADTPTLLAHLAQNDATAQIAIYKRLTDRLVA